jgi:hypothetical protein
MSAFGWFGVMGVESPGEEDIIVNHTARLLCVTAVATCAGAAPMPRSEGPIPIGFKLHKPRHVTMVIEERDGLPQR